MKALYCRAFGPETDLTVEEIDSPVPSAGEVLVSVQAAGLNFPDLLCVRGEYQFKPPLPFVPGSEGAGLVTAGSGRGGRCWTVRCRTGCRDGCPGNSSGQQRTKVGHCR